MEAPDSTETPSWASSKRNLAGERYEWNVAEPDVHISGKTAWVAYVNKGSITDATGTVNQNWLESAFLQKQGGLWKIVFMHSTRVPIATQESLENDIKVANDDLLSSAAATKRWLGYK
jgi:hypothetical protein